MKWFINRINFHLCGMVEWTGAKSERIFVTLSMRNWSQGAITMLYSLRQENTVRMAFRCSKLKIIIFQGMSEERRIIMRNLLAFVSYTLAAMSGICFVGGIAILSTGREH